ncbi:MAG: phage virion morphogenesis protein [Bacteroidaceae bacterium]|nr:phage virion morphogenesis protein [Bacteroidaceae bacterium]
MATLDPKRIEQDILQDMQVELSDEFDKNFERKAFFTEKWAARRYQNPKGSLLMVTGTMRRSIQGHVENHGVRFTSSVPYASVHNEGGSITQNVRAHQRTVKKTGKSYQVRAHQRRITMPKRQFVGDGPRTQELIHDIFDSHAKHIAEAIAQQLKP